MKQHEVDVADVELRERLLQRLFGTVELRGI